MVETSLLVFTPMVHTPLSGSIIKSDTDGEVQQPSAYSGNDSCKAISDERNGSRNAANSATAAFPETSVTIGRALQPFPRSKRSMRLSPHCAFQVGPATHEGQTRGCPREGAPAGQAYRHLLSSLHPFTPLFKDVPWRTFTMSCPVRQALGYDAASALSPARWHSRVPSRGEAV